MIGCMGAAVVLISCGATTGDNKPQEVSVAAGGSELRFGSTRSGYFNNISPHRHAFAITSSPVRYGARAERYEVRWGDCGGSDCRAPRYRSEIGIAKSLTKARFGQDIWYGWSFRNENIPSFSSSTNPSITVGQWKMGGSNKPIFKIQQLGLDHISFASCPSIICSSTLAPRTGDVWLQLGDLFDKTPATSDNNWHQVCRLFDMEAARSNWQDIVLNTNFSTGADGYVNVWVNGRQVCAYRGPIVHTTDRSLYPGPNHRRGIYVSSTGRWEAARPSQPLPTLVAYYDEFRVGRSRADVDIRLIESAGGPPVD